MPPEAAPGPAPARALTVRALDPLPAEIVPGDDLAAMIVAANGGAIFAPDAAVVVSHKVVSKAEGALIDLATVVPSARAIEIATAQDKDPALIEVILGQTAEIIRAERGVLICRSVHGFVSANAGVDQSNVRDGWCVTLPADPDRSARELRAALPGRPAVVIADSFGRAWRHGQAEIAIGAAGLAVIDDQRGDLDREGREMRATVIATADHVASAADLVRHKTSGQPAVVVEGLGDTVTTDDGPGAAALVRTADQDLFGAR